VRPQDSCVEIRAHQAAEWSNARAVIDRAFAPDPKAGHLAEWIHDSANWIADLSLVAVEDGRFVGHVMISRLPLRTSAAPVPILYLSPLSVEPAWQRRGIARALVASVLQSAASRSEPFVALEGSPSMYPKFGFGPAADYGIERPSELIPEAAFQLVTLPGYRADLRGQVEYPGYFFEIGAVGP
jgi:putative acetyltransferase